MNQDAMAYIIQNNFTTKLITNKLMERKHREFSREQSEEIVFYALIGIWAVIILTMIVDFYYLWKIQ